MLKCPHCTKEIDDKIILSYRGKQLVQKEKNKFGDKYGEEMRRRVRVRWDKKRVQS